VKKGTNTAKTQSICTDQDEKKTATILSLGHC